MYGHESAAFVIPFAAAGKDEILMPGGYLDPDHGNASQPGEFRIWLCSGTVTSLSWSTLGILDSDLEIYDAVDANGRTLAMAGPSFTFSDSGADGSAAARGGGGDPDAVPPVAAGALRHDVRSRFSSTANPVGAARRWGIALAETVAAAAATQNRSVDLNIECANGIIVKFTYVAALGTAIAPTISIGYIPRISGAQRYRHFLRTPFRRVN